MSSTVWSEPLEVIRLELDSLLIKEKEIKGQQAQIHPMNEEKMLG